jgi:hypothetical protein
MLSRTKILRAGPAPLTSRGVRLHAYSSLVGEMCMASGFMSERSAEYILVPDLIRQLRSVFPHITPFFFWASREGQRKARDSYSGPVRVLAAYARRPKVGYPGQSTIEVKFNALLFHHAWALHQAGIPLLAGVPCVSRLSDFQLDVPCAWFRIEPHKDGWGDTHAILETDSPSHAQFYHPATPVQGPLTSDALIQLAQEGSQRWQWPEIMSYLSGRSRDLLGSSFARSSWFGNYMFYRPFYLLLRDE